MRGNRALVAAMSLAMICSAAWAEGQRWKFIATGDSRGADGGINATIVPEIANAVVSEGADFVLFTGDLVTGNTDPNVFRTQLNTWQAAMAPVYDAGIGVYAVRGNHENTCPTSQAVWNSVFTGPKAMPANGPAGEEGVTFSFSHNNAIVIGLDQYSGHSHRVNQAWLDGQLAGNTQPLVLAFGHEPAFKVSHADNLDDYAAARNTFWSSLAGAGGRVYFAGHDHFYDHARLDDGDGNASDDLHQYIVGTAGAPLVADGAYNGDNSPYTPVRSYHEGNYGYVLVEVDGQDVTMTWKDRVGPGVYQATSDVFRYSVPEPASLAVLALLALSLPKRGFAALRRKRAA